MQNSQSPLVTVVTPSFNQAAYLEETLRSVLEQDYPAIEYIVMDGGSTDGSTQIIEQYADKLAFWVSAKDEGQADAIEKGFQRASGKYLAWLNSDDRYLPGTITKAVAQLEANPEAVLVYADLRSINAPGEAIHTIRYRPYSLKDLLAMEIIGQPTVVMRADAYRKAGGVASEYNFLMDHQLWLRLMALGPFIYKPELWAEARYHAAAKNVALAEGFGREAFKIFHWASAIEPYASVIKAHSKEILGGLYRFDAFYLLEGGKARQALKAYARVFSYQPGLLRRDFQRIVLAILSLFGLGGLRKILKRKYYRQ